MVKVVIVTTSACKMCKHDTGLWLEEAAAPYYAFLDKKYEVVMASTAGGPVPIDAGSMGEGFFTEACKKFMHDPAAVGALSHTVKLADIDLSTVDALYFAGGHGTCTDFVDNADIKNAIEKAYAANKVVAADCHGPVALAQCNKPDGTPLVKGLAVTGFSNSEEDAVQMSGDVPFLIETKFKEQGAKFSKGDDWSSHVQVDGKLITGQNPQSSEACAAAVIAALG